MGFRTSIYKQTKVYLDNIQINKIPEDAYLPDDEGTERIMSEAFTNSICEIANDETYCSKLYPECDEEHLDNLYRRMNKEQCANFIKYLMKKEIEYQQAHCIRNKDMDTLKDELKNGFVPDNIKYDLYDKLPTIHKFIYNQQNINLLADWYQLDLDCIDKILNNPWQITDSWSNQLCILNLIHVYHMMNWETDEFLIIGG